MKKRLVWFKGKIVSAAEANINMLTPTSQFGVNVFEGIRAYWSSQDNKLYIFRLDDHIRRLQDSIKLMDFEYKVDDSFLKTSIIETIIANNYKEDIAIRQIIFLDGDGSWVSTEGAEMLVAPIPKGRAISNKREGFNCCISSWERINTNSVSPQIKAGANYINSRMAQLEAIKNGYDSAILLNNRGTISEAPGSCIFIVKNNELITPSFNSSILHSITRSSVLEIANKILGINSIEREIDRTEIYTADEVFLCGTAVEILPVLSVDKRSIAKGIEGEVTKKIKDNYFKIVRGKSPQFTNWLTSAYL